MNILSSPVKVSLNLNLCNVKNVSWCVGEFPRSPKNGRKAHFFTYFSELILSYVIEINILSSLVKISFNFSHSNAQNDSSFNCLKQRQTDFSLLASIRMGILRCRSSPVVFVVCNDPYPEKIYMFCRASRGQLVRFRCFFFTNILYIYKERVL